MPDSVERREDLDTRSRVRDVLFAVVQERKRLKRHVLCIEAALGAMGATIIVCMASIFGVPYTGADGLLTANSQRAEENAELLDSIQAERERNIRVACEADNAQSDRQERALERFRANDATREFVRAILPQRKNCDIVVRQQIPSATRETSKASEGPR